MSFLVVWIGGETGQRARVAPLDVRRVLAGPPQVSGRFRFLTAVYVCDTCEKDDNGQPITTKIPLKVQFPKMYAPFKLKHGYDETSPDRVMTLSFANLENREDLKSFHQMNVSLRHAQIYDHHEE